MALAPGTRLGPYEISSLLGAGGMGEVYRATDTNLKRAVAIKVLPETLVADGERLARFQREAEVLASLNHPHIAQVHGLEKSVERTALVMELVEGPTLADRIAQGPIPLNEALAIAQQIAHALEAAHEQGIIHRDLKPANIKVRDDGTVKVLDFGLAKVAEPSVTASSMLSLSPTITTPAMTQAGLILGTAAYMSPEQAKGRAADKRSDVWAFGCVLYEMLTGRRAFDGEDTSDTLASVLKTDPDWTLVPADLPPAIRSVIQRCLIKDRRHRVADLSVVSFVLAEQAILSTATAPPAAALAPSSRRPWAAIAASIVATAALVGLGAWSLTASPPRRAVGKFVLTLPEGQQLPLNSRMVLAISPDGEQIVFIAGTALYIKGLGEFDAHVIPGVEAEGVLNPVFSPDGRSIAFYSQTDRTIKRISVTGGAPSTICPSVGIPFGLRWEANAIWFGQGSQGIARCAANGGKPEQLVKVAADEIAHGPQLLPDGEWVLFTIAKETDGTERWDNAKIVAHSLRSGERRTVLDSASDGRFLSTGHLVYGVGGRVYAIRFDPGQVTVRGEAVLVIDGVRRTAGAASGSVQFSVSESGDLLYAPGSPRATLEYSVAFADRSGTLTPLKIQAGRYVRVRASRDGSHLAVDSDDGTEANVYTYEIAGTRGLNRLTFGGRSLFPVWSPDGSRIAFQSDREGAPSIYVQNLDGSGVRRLTTAEKGEAHIPESWSPDGRYLSHSVLKDGWYTLWMLSLGDGKRARFNDVESQEPIGSVFAPGGGWIAYHALPRGAAALSTSSGVYVEPFPVVAGRRYQAPKVQRDFQPVWSSDGKELLYVGSAARGLLDVVPITLSGGAAFGTSSRIPFGLGANRLSVDSRAFDVLPNGRFVGLSAGTEDRALLNSQLRIVLNWFEELKSKVPAD